MKPWRSFDQLAARGRPRLPAEFTHACMGPASRLTLLMHANTCIYTSIRQVFFWRDRSVTCFHMLSNASRIIDVWMYLLYFCHDRTAFSPFSRCMYLLYLLYLCHNRTAFSLFSRKAGRRYADLDRPPCVCDYVLITLLGHIPTMHLLVPPTPT
jgi:hypothetical protein